MQVVHLYNEMRKVLPDVMSRRCIPPKAAQGRGSGLAAAGKAGSVVEAAKKREVSHPKMFPTQTLLAHGSYSSKIYLYQTSHGRFTRCRWSTIRF